MQLKNEKLKSAIQAKQKASKKDKDRLAKQHCAILIQKLWKGHSQRKDFHSLLKNLHIVKKLRSLLTTHHDNFKKSLVNGLIAGLKEAKAREMEEQEQMYQGFINVCAVNI